MALGEPLGGEVVKQDRDARRRLLGAGAIAAILAGCGTAAPAGTVEQPGFDGSDGAMTAVVAGTLAGDAERDGGCVWLELPDSQLAAIAWAFPVFLRTDDMVLVDEHAEVLAEVGDRIQLGGGFATGESIDRCMVSDTLVHAWSLNIDRG